MVKKLKNPLFTFILGAIIFGTISGVVSYSLNANEVAFAPKDTTWNVNDVKSALDDLYASTNCISGSFLHEAGTQINYNLGFIPKKIMLIMQQNSDRFTVSIYDKNFLNHFISVTTQNNGSQGIVNDVFILNDTNIVSSDTFSGFVVTNSYTVYYTGCK